MTQPTEQPVPVIAICPDKQPLSGRLPAAVEAGYTWLTILGVINSLLSLYYYLRVIAPMFFAPERETIDELPLFSKATATTCASLSLLLGLAAFLLLDSPLPLRFASRTTAVWWRLRYACWRPL
jgi:formate hydrogenlyase subunit 3/multisubunit Na+/H+ antiporter MnhD subunit